MRRFQRIDTTKELTALIVKAIECDSYRRVKDCTGGDEDFIVIDTLRKEYIWCESGFAPFCSDETLCRYEFAENQGVINLKMMERNRY